MRAPGRRTAASRSCTSAPVARLHLCSHSRNDRTSSMNKLLPVAITVSAVLAGCASTPPEEDPVQIKLNDLDARVARIERVVTNQSLVQLAQNLDSVQQETRRLRGRIDELENSNEQMKKQLAASASVRFIVCGANANNGAYGGGPGANNGAYGGSAPGGAY